jgi:hypothetical protein
MPRSQNRRRRAKSLTEQCHPAGSNEEKRCPSGQVGKRDEIGGVADPLPERHRHRPASVAAAPAERSAGLWIIGVGDRGRGWLHQDRLLRRPDL